MDAPINTLYFLVGESTIRILIFAESLLIFEVNRSWIYFFRRVGKPGIIDVPPEITMLLYSYLRVFISHFSDKKRITKMQLKAISAHPSCSMPAIAGLNRIYGARNLYLPTFISWLSGNVKTLYGTYCTFHAQLSIRRVFGRF
jgi:hypothetical protein